MSIPNKYIPPIRLDLPLSQIITETVSGVSDIVLTMNETVTAFNAVTSDGLVANSSTVTHRNRIVGLALTDINAGFSGAVRIAGEVFNPSWSWTTGDRIFLNGAALSTTPPSSGFVQLIATAKDTFTLILEIKQAVLL